MLRDKLLLAWIAYKSEEGLAKEGKAECHLSLRYAEIIFCFSSTSNAETSIKRLRRGNSWAESAWIEVSTKASGVNGHHYRLGQRAFADAEAWGKVGRMLYGPGGFLEPYLTRSIFSGKGLGPEGCCVLAAVESCGPVRRSELVKILNTHVGPSTVRKHLRFLVAEGLVVEREGEFSVTQGMAEAIERFELTYNLVERHHAHHEGILGESLKYQSQIAGSEEIRTLKAALRKLACFYCSKPAPPTGGHVEHFPPVEWGGGDSVSMLLPSCGGCNSSHGPLIAKCEGSVIPEHLEKIQIIDDESVVEWRSKIVQQMLIRASDYCAAMNDRKVEKAREMVEAQYPIQVWAALRRGPAYLELISATTGEIALFDASQRSPDVREFLDDYSGLAEMLVPRPPTVRERMKRQKS